MEDILGAVLRQETSTVPINVVEALVTSPNMKIRRAIDFLARQDLLEIDDGSITLTDEGHIEANRLVRAHRLWETYLEKTGMPQVELHDKAHQLEHISDRATVAYLDDKLGHPLEDPHGSEIPVDPTDRGTRSVPSSLMRDGERAIVIRVDDNALGLDLKPGDPIEMGPRTNEGSTWQIKTADGRQISLTHDQADAVIVSFDPQ